MDTQRSDLPLLISLDVLLEELNVTRAARRLNMSQPALSTQLARLREMFQDPLLIPSGAGRGMTPTPRALELQPVLHQALLDLQGAVMHRADFNPQQARRQFTIALADDVFTSMGVALAKELLTLGGSGLRLAFIRPNEEHLAARMERGEIDLYAGLADQMPEMLKSRVLLSDGFRFAQRKGHPRGMRPPTLEEYCQLSHVMVSTTGSFHSAVDDVLMARDLRRRVAITVPNCNQIALVLADTDCVATLSGRLLQRHAALLDIFELPFTLSPVTLAMGWHPRAQNDPAHRWLRERFVQLASASHAQRSR